MADVLISIRPEWVKKIISGEKTVELRRNIPKMPTPFRCFIYETKGGGGCGMVIGEFACLRIDRYVMVGTNCRDRAYMRKDGHKRVPIDYGPLQLTEQELRTYGRGGLLCGWHISALKIYDHNRPISDFFKPCGSSNCVVCEKAVWTGTYQNDCQNRLLSPPESWCYVEEGRDRG